MNYAVDTRHTGPSDPGLDPEEGVVHTTEGESTEDDLYSLTGQDPNHRVSIHEYIARPSGPADSRMVTDYQIVPQDRVAYHVGYIWDAEQQKWVGGGNKKRYGWELGHKKGELWQPLHLAVALDIVRKRTQQLKLKTLVRHMDLAANRPPAYGGPRKDPTDFPFWPQFRTLCFLPPYPLTIAVDDHGRQRPDVSQDVWVDVLARRSNVDAATAARWYSIPVAHGLQPGALLALFGQESEWGKTDANRKNWGNVRKAWKPERQIGTESNGIAVFSSFDDSLLDCCERIREHPSYLPNGNNDLATWRVIWSPVGDGVNNPFNDAIRMRGWITDWVAQTEAITPPPPDYAALWGDAAPYIPEFGIPTWFRGMVDSGNSPGKVLEEEEHFPDGTTRQNFEHAEAVYTDATGTVTWTAH